MKTTAYIGTSLDGFIARQDGDISWLEKFADEDFFRAYDAFMDRIEKVLTFPTWPYRKKVFVLSSSLGQVPDNLKERVTIIFLEPVALLRSLSGNGFSRVCLDGGKVVQSFLKADLIDELIISRVPVLIGRGIPLFGDLDTDRSFRHIRTESYPNGLIRSQYEKTDFTGAAGSEDKQ